MSTALLVRERGARATSLDLVLAHSGAPRGSIYHHFPGGREQLLREATVWAGDYVARRLQRDGADGPLGSLEALFDEYCESLVASDFRAGCPVVAVAVESPEDGPDLRDCVLAAFESWKGAIATSLVGAGVDSTRAADLAIVIIAAFEGGLILARASRDLKPLESVRRELRQRINAELARSEAQHAA